MSAFDNIRARLPWAITTGSDTASIEPLTLADAGRVRLPWLSRLTPERLAAQVSANPQLSLWMPQTGEYALAGSWRNRDDIAHVVEATTRRGQARLVGELSVRATEMGYRLMVLSDEVAETNRKLYAGLGFRHLERVIILKRGLKRLDELPDPSALPQVEMRRAGYADLDTLVGVDHESFPWLWWNSKREFEVYVQMDDVHVYLAYIDGAPAGYVSFTIYDDWAHLDRIGVVSARHGQGLGAAQLAYVLRLMAGTGADYVALSTQLSNTQSHKLYERFGFSRTGESMDFFGLKL